MSSRYLDKHRFCVDICIFRQDACRFARCPMWNAPDADVAEVVRGKWLRDTKNEGRYHCSNCLKHFKAQFGSRTKAIVEGHGRSYGKLPPYCEMCGARLEGVADVSWE